MMTTKVTQPYDGRTAFHDGSRTLVVALALAAHAVMAGLSAGIYDEAKVWFRGGYDANDDGFLSAGEFVDSSRPKSDAAHQTVTLTGAGAVRYAKGPVWSAFNPLYTNEQYYVSLTNGDCATSAECSGIRIVNPVAEGETWNDFTIFMRFRWDGKFSPADATHIRLFNTGQIWAAQKGVAIDLQYFAETDDFAPVWNIGASARGQSHQTWTSPPQTTGIRLEPGKWNDWMITVHDPGKEGSASIHIYTGAVGRVSGEWNENLFRDPWRSATFQQGQNFRVVRLGMDSTDTITLGDTTFSGDIAAWALWPKMLSAAERREALADPRPGDALFRIGKEDGKSDEFAAASAAQYDVRADGTWDVVPAGLDAMHRTLTIRFDVPAKYDQLNQILRVVPVSGNGWLDATVTDTVRGTSVQMRRRRVVAGQAADFFVPQAALRTGEHAITLTYDHGGGMTFDVIELCGSFLLGVMDYDNSPNAQFLKTSGLTCYDVVEGYWPAMNGEISADDLDPDWGAYNADSQAATAVRFNVPSELVACTNKLHLKLNQWSGTPDSVTAYVNGNRVLEETSSTLYQYKILSCVLPPGTFTAGENLIRVRRRGGTGIGGTGPWWGGVRGIQVQIQNILPPDEFGLVILFK